MNRLKLYKSKLVVFPRNPTSKRAKKGDATKEQRKAIAPQNKTKNVVAVPVESHKAGRARKITAAERDADVWHVLRKARTDAKRWGAREKRAKDKATEAAAKGKGKADDGMDE